MLKNTAFLENMIKASIVKVIQYNSKHCVKYAEIRVFSDRIFPYKDRIVDSVL